MANARADMLLGEPCPFAPPLYMRVRACVFMRVRVCVRAFAHVHNHAYMLRWVN